MDINNIGKELREYKALGTVEEIKKKFELLMQYQEQGSIQDFIKIKEKAWELLAYIEKENRQNNIIKKLYKRFESNRLIGQRHV